jgi:hypothetical protein
MAKKIDPKAKAKRQKIFAAIGGVILLGLLAFQVPRTMKMLHPAEESTSSSAPAATTATTPTSPIAAPSLAGGNATATAAPGGDGLVDADAPPAPQSGQLLAFGLFRTKDPFKQQLEVSDGTGSGGTTPSTGTTDSTGGKPSTAPTDGGAVASSSSGGNAKGGTAPTMRVTSPPPGAVTTAEIAVNGVAQTVQVGGVFPSSDPFFKLVKLTRKGAQISIAGGSLANGAPTVMLTKTKPLTLQNTSDGTRYVLRLLSVS